jgi:hypothetical protein
VGSGFLIEQVVPAIIALAVVLGWVFIIAVGRDAGPELRDAAIAVLGFYFGQTAHRGGVTSGAAAVTTALTKF